MSLNCYFNYRAGESNPAILEPVSLNKPCASFPLLEMLDIDVSLTTGMFAKAGITLIGGYTGSGKSPIMYALIRDYLENANKAVAPMICVGEVHPMGTLEAMIGLSKAGMNTIGTISASSITQLLSNYCLYLERNIETGTVGRTKKILIMQQLIENFNTLLAFRKIKNIHGDERYVFERLTFTDELIAHLSKYNNGNHLLFLGEVSRIMDNNLFGAKGYNVLGDILIKGGLIDEKNYQALLGLEELFSDIER